MFGARKTVVLCSAALLVACEPVSEPEVGSPIPTLHQERGPVASSVVGSGNYLVNGQLRNFSFTALEIGGLVDGQFQLFNRAFDFRVHGIVTCFLLIGNEAVIGGTVTQSTTGLLGERVWRVVDNRPPGTVPDQLSILRRPVADLGLTDAAEFCDPNNQNRPDLDLTDIERGNITVRDNPPAAPN